MIQGLDNIVEQCPHDATDDSHQHIAKHVCRGVQVAEVTCGLLELGQCGVCPNSIDSDRPLAPVGRQARKESVLKVVRSEKASCFFDHEKRPCNGRAERRAYAASRARRKKVTPLAL